MIAIEMIASDHSIYCVIVICSVSSKKKIYIYIYLLYYTFGSEKSHGIG